jgi:hypothetical protein
MLKILRPLGLGWDSASFLLFFFSSFARSLLPFFLVLISLVSLVSGSPEEVQSSSELILARVKTAS